MFFSFSSYLLYVFSFPSYLLYCRCCVCPLHFVIVQDTPTKPSSKHMPPRFSSMIPSQATRERSVLIHIMRDIPRQDTRPELHAQLLLCMFNPIFAFDDLCLSDDKSWADALQRAENLNDWDPRSFTMRLDIRTMLTQRLAADHETTRRKPTLLRRKNGATSVVPATSTVSCLA